MGEQLLPILPLTGAFNVPPVPEPTSAPAESE
jgi:hypothetical protein